MHQYFGTLHPKSKTYKWIYNKNAKLKWIPKLFTEHKIYLFQSNIQLRGKMAIAGAEGICTSYYGDLTFIPIFIENGQ